MFKRVQHTYLLTYYNGSSSIHPMQKSTDPMVERKLREYFEKDDFSRFKALSEKTGFDLKYYMQTDQSPSIVQAATSGKYDFVRYFYEKGFDLNKKYYASKETVLSIVLREVEDSQHMLQFLLDLGADPNAKNINGYTPLISEAAGRCRVDYMRLLVQNGADTNVIVNRQIDGWVDQAFAHDFAKEQKNELASEYLMGSKDLTVDITCDQWQFPVLDVMTNLINGPYKNKTSFLEQYLAMFIEDPSLIENTTVKGIHGLTVASIGGIFEIYTDYCKENDRIPNIEKLTDAGIFRLGAVGVVDVYGQFELLMDRQLWKNDMAAFGDFVDALPMTLQMKYKLDIEAVKSQMIIANTKKTRAAPNIKRRMR